MLFLLWIIILLEVLIFLRIETKILKSDSIKTPLFFLGSPFLIVTFLALLFNEYLGFISVNYFVFVIWFMAIFLFWSFGFLVNYYLKYKIKYATRLNKKLITSKDKEEHMKLISVLLLICAIPILIRVYSFSNSTIHVYASDVFANALGQGIYGWLRIGVLVTVTYLLCIFNYKKILSIEVFAISIGLCTLFINQIKGIALIPLLAMIIYRYMCGQFKFSFKLVLISILSLYSVFYIAYAMPYILAKNFTYILSNSYFMLVNQKIVGYLFSGILGFSGALDTNLSLDLPAYTAIAPIYNILRRLWGGQRAQLVSPSYIDISENQTSNVYTIFGTIWEISGWLGVVFLSSIIGLIGYYLFFRYKQNNNNKWIGISYSTFVSYLAFGVFDYFFYHTYVVIMITIMVVLGFYLSKKIRIKF